MNEELQGEQAVEAERWASRRNVTEERVDTRGAWPTFMRGAVGIKLPGKPHDISVENARAVATALGF